MARKRNEREDPPDPVTAAREALRVAEAGRQQIQDRIAALEDLLARATSDSIAAEDTGDDAASTQAVTGEHLLARKLAAAKTVLGRREAAVQEAQEVLRQAEADVALVQKKVLEDWADNDNIEASGHIEAALVALGHKRERLANAHAIARVHQLGHVRESRLLLSRSAVLSPLADEVRRALSPLRAGISKDVVRQQMLAELDAEP